MPLDDFQKYILSIIGQNRKQQSVVVGGSMLHLNGTRLSGDIDIFHPDTVERDVAVKNDIEIIGNNSLHMDDFKNNDLYSEFTIFKENDFPVTLQYGIADNPVFLPLIQEDNYVRLNIIDLAINKCCAFIDRNVTRDYYDMIFIHNNIMPLENVFYATAGRRDFNPFSINNFLQKKLNMTGFDFKELENDLVQPECEQNIKSELKEILLTTEEKLLHISENITFRENVGKLVLTKENDNYDFNSDDEYIFKKLIPITDAKIVYEEYLDNKIQNKLKEKYNNEPTFPY